MADHGSSEGAAARDTYDVLGHRARIEVPDPAARREVRSLLRGFGPVGDATGEPFVPYRLATDDAGRWVASTRGITVYSADDLATALAALEWQIVTTALARRRDLFHLHGASLVLPGGGGCLLLIGDSGTGKTTLTLGLIGRDFLPLSDDVTLIDAATLAAQPLPRAFHLEEGTRQLLAARALPAGWDLDDAPPGYCFPPAWAAAPAPVACVVFPQYQPGATPHLTRLAIPDAASALLANTISLTRIPKVALATVARLTATTPCYRFVGGELDTSLDALAGLLDSGTGAAGPR